MPKAKPVKVTRATPGLGSGMAQAAKSKLGSRASNVDAAVNTAEGSASGKKRKSY